ncbi:hypothetical protein GCM10009530_43340 [Microbispora corallina]|uniref:Integrase catalytic domain-containing protein n=1 Tax=Microbispora corallina TaxID=83302 RepID=A0ABQ4FX90_9ACTN|nr:integrase core domain-containing protein [Microbispora corallina]GIH39407.1 hypothetical protein Mco01_24070 [Microbispora corallina]
MDPSRAPFRRKIQRPSTLWPHPCLWRFPAPRPQPIRPLNGGTCPADFTHYRLADGTDAEILTWPDDHSRYALSVTAHNRVTGPIVRDTFRHAVAAHGVPASTLTDNGMVFTTRLSGGRGGRNAFEHELRRLHVTQKNSTPNHPTTCGKVERFQQTMKKWLRAQPDQPTTIGDLQTLIDRFADAYNHHRPHRSLPHRATPAAVYNTRPKAQPAGSRDGDTHTRVHRPQPRLPAPKQETPEPVGSRVSDVLRHHTGRGDRI